MSTGAVFLFIVFALMLYFLPAITAIKRGVEHTVPICALNLIFGLTFLGWVGALIWACYSRPRESADDYVVIPRYLDGDVVGRKVQLPYPVITDMRVRFDPPPLRRT